MKPRFAYSQPYTMGFTFKCFIKHLRLGLHTDMVCAQLVAPRDEGNDLVIDGFL